jgi:hypothetical protein
VGSLHAGIDSDCDRLIPIISIIIVREASINLYCVSHNPGLVEMPSRELELAYSKRAASKAAYPHLEITRFKRQNLDRNDVNLRRGQPGTVELASFSYISCALFSRSEACQGLREVPIPNSQSNLRLSNGTCPLPIV